MEKCSKEKEIGVMQNDIKTLYRRVESVEVENKGMRELITSVAILAENTKGIKDDVADVKQDVGDVRKEVGDVRREVREIREAPLKDYSKIKMLIIGAIISGNCWLFNRKLRRLGKWIY